MSDNEEVKAHREMTPRQLLAEGWRLTRAILGLKGMNIPYTINFQIDGESHEQATRVATLEEVAKAIATLDEAIEQRGEDDSSVRGLHGHLSLDQLNKQRSALMELEKRASQGGASASTTVIEALFPEVPVKKRTPRDKADLERWLAIRKEEALRIDPETAEVYWTYAQTLDPYGVFDEWELPEEFDQIGREYFARAPGSDIWVAFRDLPRETLDRLRGRPRRKHAFPAGSDGLSDIGEDADRNDDLPF